MWSLARGRSWLIQGANGAGKSTFVKLVRGDIWPIPGCGERLYHLNGSAESSPSGFREQTGVVTPEMLDEYKRSDFPLSVFNVVLSGLTDTLFFQGFADAEESRLADDALRRTAALDLASRDFRTLSLGQAKRVLISRAIIKPRLLLIFDEVCSGLDRSSRTALQGEVRALIESGAQILYTTHVQDSLAEAFSHSLLLDGGRIISQGPITRKPIIERRRPAATEPAIATLSRKPDTRRTLIRLDDASLRLGGVTILDHINWRIQAREHWALMGENGAGKSSLLRLIAGDHYPVWGGVISRFGQSNGSTLRDHRRKIGLVSADLHTEHSQSQSCVDLVVSGLYGSVGMHERPLPAQVAKARALMERYGLGSPAEQETLTVSYGQMRKLLILRAIVHEPQLLLLDEPLSGLDAPSRTEILSLLDELAQQSVTVVYATHRADEIPPWITQVLRLRNGAREVAL